MGRCTKHDGVEWKLVPNKMWGRREVHGWQMHFTLLLEQQQPDV
jgi:hypothetical protein